MSNFPVEVPTGCILIRRRIRPHKSDVIGKRVFHDGMQNISNGDLRRLFSLVTSN
jgi:hypothetical protein